MSKLNALFVSYSQEDEYLLQSLFDDLKALKKEFPGLVIVQQEHGGPQRNKKAVFTENSLRYSACSSLLLVASTNYLSDSFYKSLIRKDLAGNCRKSKVGVLIAGPVDLSREPIKEFIQTGPTKEPGAQRKETDSVLGELMERLNDQNFKRRREKMGEAVSL